jgi:hypothetical protein
MTVEVRREDDEIIILFRTDDDDVEGAKGEGFLSLSIYKGDEPDAKPCLCCILSVSDDEGRESFLVATPDRVTIFKGGDDITVTTGKSSS